MNTLRKHGNSPYTVAVLHGGPGAPGSAEGLALAVAPLCGTLEPMQNEDNIDGQVAELVRVLAEHARLPATLVGWSWGAMLAYIAAARHPVLFRKVILVGSAVFEDRHAEKIMPVRLGRLESGQRKEAREIMSRLADREATTEPERALLLARLGQLMEIADTFDPVDPDFRVGPCCFETHVKVWTDAQKLRASGELLEMGRRIRCPVVGIHGDYDPHPAEGVRDPLSAAVQDFRFFLLKDCGHSPWNERRAREEFLSLLRTELRPCI